MVRRLLLALGVLVVVLVAGGALLVRAWLDPERVRQTLEQQATRAVGQPVAIGAAELSVWPRAGVALHDLAVGSPAALTLKRTSLSTAMRALVSRRIEDAELLVEDSTVDLPLLLATLERLSTADTAEERSAGEAAAPAAGGSASGVTLVNVRSISLRNIRVQAGPRSAVLSLQSSLDGDQLRVDTASVTSEVTTLTASGVVDSLASRRATLTLKAESLDLDGLLVFAEEFARHAPPAGAGGQAPGQAAAPAGPVDITLDISADRGRAGGVTFDGLTTRARITPGQVALDPLSLGIFGGRMQGSVRADLSGAEPALAVGVQIQGIDMARLVAFAGQPGTVTGTLGGSVTVQGRGAEPGVALARARGDGQIAIANGTMKGLQLVRPIVLAFGRPDAAQPVDGGERFDRLDARFTLAGGVLTLTSLAFQSRDVELDGSGRLSLTAGTIDVAANARLSRELTAQAGRDLVRYTADDGRVTVPATVTGTIESPQVSVNVGSLARRAVANEARRQTDELKQKSESAIRGLLRRKKQ